MKRNFNPFVWTVILFNITNLIAQNTYKSKNLMEVSGGWGFYSPSDKIKAAYTSLIDPWGQTVYNPDEGDYGGIGMSFRVLFAVKSSPIKIGGEIGGFTMRKETMTTSLVYVDSGDPVTSDDFLNGNNLLLLMDVFLFSAGKSVVHTEFGIGYLVYWDTSIGFGKAPFDPASELVTSAKLIFTIPIAEKYSLDPQFIITKGFSDNDVLVYHAHLGFTALW